MCQLSKWNVLLLFLFAFLNPKENLRVWNLHSHLGWTCLDHFPNPRHLWKVLFCGGREAAGPLPAPPVIWAPTALIVSWSHSKFGGGWNSIYIFKKTMLPKPLVEFLIVYLGENSHNASLELFRKFGRENEFFIEHSLLMNVLCSTEMIMRWGTRCGFFMKESEEHHFSQWNFGVQQKNGNVVGALGTQLELRQITVVSFTL